MLSVKNVSHRLGMPKAADITKARALATRRGKYLKLNISYGHELINWEMSVYFLRNASHGLGMLNHEWSKHTCFGKVQMPRQSISLWLRDARF